MSQIKLGEKQRIAIKNFFIKLQKYRITTGDNELCIRLNNNDNKLALFEDEAKAYQYYAYQVIKRLIQKGIFYKKVAVNPETGKKVKVLCINRQQFQNIQDLVFKLENEIKARF